jgi:glycosyltransferase involved in cell wall biosynthesis
MYATDSLRDELVQNGITRLAKWERGVDANLFHPDRRKVHNGLPVALYFGRVSKEKNIEAFLNSEWSGHKIVVGDGPHLDALKSKYPNVEYTGKLVGKELAEVVASADVSVFPSKTDTYGLTMIESMACGTPVAAFNVTGPRDVILHGKTGYLSNDESLSEAMHSSLSVSRKECRKFAEGKTWEVCTDQFYSNLVFI